MSGIGGSLMCSRTRNKVTGLDLNEGLIELNRKRTRKVGLVGHCKDFGFHLG